MKMQGLTNQHAVTMQQAQQKRAGDGIRRNLEATARPAIEVQTRSTVQVHQSEGKARGAVCLLQDGHFKGVADVRLRLNFHSKILEMNTQRAGEVLEAGTQELVEHFGARVEGFGRQFGFGDQVGELISTFEDAVTGFGDSTEDGPLDPSAVLAEVRDALSDLLASLQPLGQAAAGAVAENDGGADAVTPVEETAVEGSAGATAETGATVEKTFSFAVALQDLQDWFDTEVNSLQTTVAEVLSLPPLSEPRGSGVAYGRFLEIYNKFNELNGEGIEENGATGAGGVQTVV